MGLHLHRAKTEEPVYHKTNIKRLCVSVNRDSSDRIAKKVSECINVIFRGCLLETRKKWECFQKVDDSVPILAIFSGSHLQSQHDFMILMAIGMSGIHSLCNHTSDKQFDLLTKYMITDRIGPHEVLSPINRKYYTFRAS